MGWGIENGMVSEWVMIRMGRSENGMEMETWEAHVNTVQVL